MPGPGCGFRGCGEAPKAKGRGLRGVRMGGAPAGGFGFFRVSVVASRSVRLSVRVFVSGGGRLGRRRRRVPYPGTGNLGGGAGGRWGVSFRLAGLRVLAFGPGAGQQVDHLRVGSGSEVAVEESDGPAGHPAGGQGGGAGGRPVVYDHRRRHCGCPARRSEMGATAGAPGPLAEAPPPGWSPRASGEGETG